MTRMTRVFGIAVVWLGCSTCWVVLGSTLLVRSETTLSSGDSAVYRLWGPPVEQHSPSAFYLATRMVDGVRTITGADGVSREVSYERRETYSEPVALVESNIDVNLDLEHRRRGLNWYPTYAVDFDAKYRFTNRAGEGHDVTFRFPFSQGNAVFDGFVVRDEAGLEVGFETANNQATWAANMPAGQTREFRVSFRSRGTERWLYSMGEGTSRVTDFQLNMETDFAEVDFPEESLSPTAHGPGVSRFLCTRQT